ncbi:hypothetical protein BST81_10815 [Leptolyngbya sp. 'hensonii']|uniref:Ycf51 family protein n=1 Tax=Leptolyngbya sp. 'hensonii' TaxID=1922337 RepID=UPI00094FE7EB|nr:Ycf51 family protein [Leptolyngbya sp. 'hensonii']OLP18451.1 hypothetical protein BST81_10815 [Leptolyngbya sp. 'hensonii']
MPTIADFLIAAKWAGFTTLGFAALATLGFVLQWGLRFRLIGVTGFMAVLTVGLFSLSLAPFAHKVIPGAVGFSTIYDNGANLVVILVPREITETQLEATLRQAAGNLFSAGRLSRGRGVLLRARTIVHPEPGVSEPVFLGQVKPATSPTATEPFVIQIDAAQMAKISA